MHQVANGVSIGDLEDQSYITKSRKWGDRRGAVEDEDAAIFQAAKEQTDFLFGKHARFRSSSGFESVHEVMRDAITKFKTVSTPPSPTVQRTKSESQIGQKKKLTFKEKN